MPRWPHVVFGGVWLIAACVFGRLAYDAHASEATELTRFSFRIPSSFNVQLGSVRFQDVINGLAEAHDRNVAALEDSIRRSARTAFVLNIVSCFAALFGFIAQVGSYLHGSRVRTATAPVLGSHP